VWRARILLEDGGGVTGENTGSFVHVISLRSEGDVTEAREMRRERAAFVLAVGFLAIAPIRSSAEGQVTRPALTPGEVAKAVTTRMDYLRWSREFKGRVVRWSGVVVQPTAEHQKWFDKWFRGELLQLDLKDLRCDLSVPDATPYAIGTTVTFTGTLEGYLGPDMEKDGHLAQDKPAVNFRDITIHSTSR
jgi:hypothetical protein